MKLYHGTNVQFNEVDISKSNPFKDFGQGFYLTDIRKQAEAMADKKVKLFGGISVIQEYEFLEEQAAINGLNIKVFHSPSSDWAEFVFKNRSRELNFHHEFDVVIGPIANDGVAYLLGRYEEGTLTLDELARELEFRELNSQYFFGTHKALKYLKRL